MIQLADYKKCTGCMACLYSCAKQAIDIKKDMLGHIYPSINANLCMECGKCYTVCPVIGAVPKYYPRKAFAAWSMNKDTHKSSASGGAASEMYSSALENGFWICGVEYDAEFRAVHTVTKEQNKLAKYRQSKYVFSEIGDAYKKIKVLLDSGESVLFISLPCKVAGLRKFLKQKYDGLITVDIVCHGVPSYDNLIKHIKAVTKNDMVTSLRFRMDNEFMFLLQNKRKVLYRQIGRQDTYLAAFLEGINYRESCYQCEYACEERTGDITICDFWGLGQTIPFDHPYCGSISAVLINTDVGERFFSFVRKNMFCEERPVKEAIDGNAQLRMSTAYHYKREEFKQEFGTLGFEEAVSKCLSKEIKEDRKNLNKRIFRQRLRKLAGVFIKRYRG